MLSCHCYLTLKGINPYGSRIIVKNLYTDASLPLPYHRLLLTFLTYSPQIKGETGLKIIQAVGPYTIPADLSYDPLSDLMSSVKVQKPDLLVLFGPFVDAQHPIIKSGYSGSSYANLFDNQVPIFHSFYLTRDHTATSRP